MQLLIFIPNGNKLLVYFDPSSVTLNGTSTPAGAQENICPTSVHSPHRRIVNP
jgi:hypothetical protein